MNGLVDGNCGGARVYDPQRLESPRDVLRLTEPRAKKAAEGRRTPRRCARHDGQRRREASWSAPVLWRLVRDGGGHGTGKRLGRWIGGSAGFSPLHGGSAGEVRESLAVRWLKRRERRAPTWSVAVSAATSQ